MSVSSSSSAYSSTTSYIDTSDDEEVPLHFSIRAMSEGSLADLMNQASCPYSRSNTPIAKSVADCQNWILPAVVTGVTLLVVGVAAHVLRK